jgi:hypothetical protein
MTVNNPQQQGKDHRSQPRWSAGKMMDVVLRLLRGESLAGRKPSLPAPASRTDDDDTWPAAHLPSFGVDTRRLPRSRLRPS